MTDYARRFIEQVYVASRVALSIQRQSLQLQTSEGHYMGLPNSAYGMVQLEASSSACGCIGNLLRRSQLHC